MAATIRLHYGNHGAKWKALILKEVSARTFVGRLAENHQDAWDGPMAPGVTGEWVRFRNSLISLRTIRRRNILLGEMDIDQRLDRLTARHEALSQTMELVAHMQQKNEEAHQKNEALLEKNQILIEKSQILIVQVIESVDSLARIAHLHENRITDLEGRRQ